MIEFVLKVLAWTSRKMLVLERNKVSSKTSASLGSAFRESSPRVSNKSRAIVITTFSQRFFNFCLPLVKNIVQSEIDLPIYVVINADWSGPFDAEVRSEFLRELAKLPSCYPVCLGTASGMSKMWNAGLRAAGAESTLVLNDDTLFHGDSLRDSLEGIFQTTSSQHLVVINGSFGHFGISKSCMAHVGEFDERFLGFGEEDADFYWRFEEAYSRPPAKLNNVIGIFNVSDVSGYENHISPPGLGKYSLFNSVFVGIKYKFGEGSISGMFDRPAKRVLGEPDFFELQKWVAEHSQLMTVDDPAVILEKLSNFQA